MAESNSFEISAIGQPWPLCNKIDKTNTYNCGEYHFESKDWSHNLPEGNRGKDFT
jgi:hypothetical protein